MSTTLEHFSIVNQVNIAPETTVVLVGTALDGPANVPFQLYENVDPYVALGFSPLAHAYSAARRAGASRVVAYRINGIHSVATVKDENGNELFSLKTVSAADYYDDIHVVLYPDHLTVVNTDGATSRSYWFDKYPTVDDLVYGLNRDAYYGLIEFNAELINQYAPMMNAVSTETNVVFTDGDDEANFVFERDPSSLSYANPTDLNADGGSLMISLKAKLANALFGEDPDNVAGRLPYGDLASMQYGIIVLVDMFHDDDAEITEMLGSFCMNKTLEMEVGCIGVIGTRNLYADDDVHQRALDLVSLTESLADTEAYKYVQVIVGHTTYPESNGESVSCAYAFGAIQAMLPYNTMMSNKAIYGIRNLNFALSKEDVALLSGNGYTCIVPSIRRGFVPFYSNSYSKDSTAATSRPHNVRISQHISSAIANEVDSLIGSEYTILSVKNAIDGAKSLLSDLQTANVIKNYGIDYSLTDNNTSLTIEVSFTPISEITAISSVTTLTFPREVTY
jgi:hypothetical protein